MRSSVIVAIAALLVGAAPAVAGERWAWPVRGPVASVYEHDNARPYAGGMHRGIDIAADEGTTVVAARPGTVTYAGALGSVGNVVAVRTGRYAVSYLHLASVSVRRGQTVAKGTRVGAVGTTGRRSVREPHLHFGVRVEERYVDPLSLLPASGRDRVAFVPAGPVRRAETGWVRHPAVAVSPARVPAAAPDRGRPLVLGGLVLLALVLFGGLLIRANCALSAHLARVASRAAGSLKSLGAYRGHKSSAAG